MKKQIAVAVVAVAMMAARVADRSLVFYELRAYCKDNKRQCAAFERRVKYISCCAVKRVFYEDNKAECMKNRDVNDAISCAGVDMLPITILDGTIYKVEEYPSNQELMNMEGQKNESI